MRITSIIGLITLLFLSSCNNSEEENLLQVETFNYYENYQIVDVPEVLLPGNDLVLHYYYADSPELLAADAGIIENLFIQLPQYVSENPTFSITDNNIPDLKIEYTQSCFCYPVTDALIRSINLEGIDLGNKILITGSVEIELKYNDSPVSDGSLRNIKTFRFIASDFRESVF
ncbi:MAG: hypothetical protein AAFQ94_25690 [Bacteroidota bacterium]